VAAAAMPHPLHYITRVGDTLVTIADRFNVTVDQLRRWNHLSSSAIKPHSTLDVAEPVHLAPATHVAAKPSQPTHSGATKSAPATSTAGAKKPASVPAAKQAAARPTGGSLP